MKVFVTGIAGFLGSFIAEEFLKLGFDVSGGDNLVGGYKDNVPKRQPYTRSISIILIPFLRLPKVQI